MILPLLVLKINQISRQNTRNMCPVISYTALNMSMVIINRKEEDGVKVVTVENLHNPYEEQGNFNPRFKLTMNKLYAWTLASYDRVVMLDSDNLFLHRTDELFQCGDFCAAFINPCVFHTGLFVLRVLYL